MSNTTQHILAWVLKVSEDGTTETWTLSNSKVNIFITAKKGAMSHVNENGALANVVFCNGELVGHPIVVEPQITAGFAYKQFQMVMPGHEEKLRVMWTLLGLIVDPALKAFYWSVLSDDKIMSKFYRAKASESHHHCHEGGLFEHSVDVATSAVLHARQNGLGDRTANIAFVSGILHDIGKIEMYYNNPGAKKADGCQHEALSFMVLSEQLEALKAADAVLFDAISSTLTAKMGSSRNEYLSETIVRMCDRISADAHRTRQVFAGKPAHYWYVRSARDKRVFKRLDEA